MDFFTPYMDRITELCRQHQVASLHAFGSAARGSLQPDSDVELLIDLPMTDPHAYADSYWALLNGFESLFKRPVDLLERKSVKNPYRERLIDRDKVALYGA